MQLTDLLNLLDDHPHHFEVACFARDLAEHSFVKQTVLQEAERLTIIFPQGNRWFRLRVEEQLGIVVVSHLYGDVFPPPCAEGDHPPLRDSLRRARAAIQEEMQYLPKQYALLRSPAENRNLPFVFTGSTTEPDWEVYNTMDATGRLRWLKKMLWADIRQQEEQLPPLPNWEFRIDRDMCADTGRWTSRLADVRRDDGDATSLRTLTRVTAAGTYAEAFLCREKPLPLPKDADPRVTGLRSLCKVSVQGACSEEAAIHAVERAAVIARIFREREPGPQPPAGGNDG